MLKVIFLYNLITYLNTIYFEKCLHLRWYSFPFSVSTTVRFGVKTKTEIIVITKVLVKFKLGPAICRIISSKINKLKANDPTATNMDFEFGDIYAFTLTAVPVTDTMA